MLLLPTHEPVKFPTVEFIGSGCLRDMMQTILFMSKAKLVAGIQISGQGLRLASSKVENNKCEQQGTTYPVKCDSS